MGADGAVTIKLDLEPGNVKRTASELQKEIRSIFNQTGGTGSKDITALLSQLKKAYNDLDALNAKLQQAQDAKILDPDDLEDLKVLQRDLKAAQREYAALTEKMNQMQTSSQGGSPEFTKIKSQANEVARSIQRIEWEMNIVKELAHQDEEGVRSASIRVDEASDRVQQLLNKYREATKEPEKQEERWQRVKRVLAGIKTGADKIKHSFSKSTDEIGKGIKKLMRYTLGIRSAFMLVRRLRSGIKEGLQNLAKQFPEANKTLSVFSTDMQYLKNSLGAVAFTIWKSVAPTFDKIVDKIVEGINWLNQFIGAWTGQSKVYRAIKVEKKFAESAEDAADALKEQKKQLAGYDKLDVISKTESASEAVQNASEMMFEEVDVQQKFKDMVAGLDFYDLLSLGLTKLAERLPELIAGVSGLIAKILAGIDWNALLTAVVGGINNIFEGVFIGLFGDDTTKKLFFGRIDLEIKKLNLEGRLNNLKSTYEDTIASIAGKDYQLQNTIDRYFELAGKVDRTEEEEKQFKKYQDYLMQELPGFAGLLANKGTKSWEALKKEVQGAKDEYVKYLKLQAGQKFLSGLYETYFEAIIEEKKSRKELENLIKEMPSYLQAKVYDANGNLKSNKEIFDFYLKYMNSANATAIGGVSQLLQVSEWVNTLEGYNADINSNLERIQLTEESIFGTVITTAEKVSEAASKVDLDTADAADNIKKTVTETVDEIESKMTEGGENANEGFADAIGDTTEVDIRMERIKKDLQLKLNEIKSLFANSKILGTLGISGAFANFNIPGLASGSVLPPNQPFLALVGDQKSGTNVEAPLSTIKQAVREELNNMGAGGGAPIILQLDGKMVAQVVWDANEQRYKQYGSYLPAY